MAEQVVHWAPHHTVVKLITIYLAGNTFLTFEIFIIEYIALDDFFLIETKYKLHVCFCALKSKWIGFDNIYKLKIKII